MPSNLQVFRSILILSKLGLFTGIFLGIPSNEWNIWGNLSRDFFGDSFMNYLTNFSWNSSIHKRLVRKFSSRISWISYRYWFRHFTHYSSEMSHKNIILKNFAWIFFSKFIQKFIEGFISKPCILYLQKFIRKFSRYLFRNTCRDSFRGALKGFFKKSSID